MSYDSSDPIIVSDQETLEQLCVALKQSPYIAIDTEFIRERTYYAKLCLIQVATDELSVLIDALGERLDLSPLYDVLRNQSILKVFHAARQDIQIFYDAMGSVPTPLFDTQVAAMVCGYGDQIGYDNLVNAITGHHIDKSTRLLDWSFRPLTPPQKKYALEDVTYLRDVYKYLFNLINQNNRFSWIEDEMAVLSSPKTYEVVPDKAYLRLKVRSGSRRFMGILQDCADWRERQAQKLNIPRSHLIKDESLLQLAAHPPQQEKDILKMRQMTKNSYLKTHFNALYQVIQASIMRPEETLPEAVRKKFVMPAKANGALIDLLRVLLRVRSESEGVASCLLVNSADLEKIALSEAYQSLPVMAGWRYEIFGRDAIALCQGKVALVSQNGKIATIKTNGAAKGFTPGTG